MTLYWRLKDVPELQSLPPSRRRRLWREAVTRSLTPRYLLLLFANLVLGAFVCGVAVNLLWPGERPWSWILGLPLGGMLNDYLATQPRAHRWLREHAGELARYVSL